MCTRVLMYLYRRIDWLNSCDVRGAIMVNKRVERAGPLTNTYYVDPGEKNGASHPQ